MILRLTSVTSNAPVVPPPRRNVMDVLWNRSKGVSFRLCKSRLVLKNEYHAVPSSSSSSSSRTPWKQQQQQQQSTSQHRSFYYYSTQIIRTSCPEFYYHPNLPSSSISNPGFYSSSTFRTISTATSDNTTENIITNNNNNIVSLRLYRILLRQCKELEEYVQTTLHKKSLYTRKQNMNSKSLLPNEGSRILLQTKLDPRRAGSFRIIMPSEGSTDNKKYNATTNASPTDNTSTTTSNTALLADDISSIIRFFYLQHLYATSKDHDIDDDNDDDDDDDDDDNDKEKYARKRKNQQQLDEMCSYFEYVILKQNSQRNVYDENFIQRNNSRRRNHRNYYEHTTLWTSVDQIRQAIRTSYKASKTYGKESEWTEIWEQHNQSQYNKYAIDAYRCLNQQRAMIPFMSISHHRDVHITVTSQCIGKSYIPPQQHHQISSHNATVIHQLAGVTVTQNEQLHPNQNKFRYAYRIRIENQSSSDTIQLLGRTWIIYDSYLDDPEHQLQTTPDDDDDKAAAAVRNYYYHHHHHQPNEPIRVHAPNTGAVGQLPVLTPGMVFEYMSGAEAGPEGRMKGCFHFAKLRTPTKDAASTTTSTTAAADEDDYESIREYIQQNEYHNIGYRTPITNLFEERFEVPVAPFSLRSDGK